MSHSPEGRTVLVTGGGRGLGRSHAEHLAARGYAVVVNDTGCELDGSGRSGGVADEVVAAVRARGGEACASTDDVSTHEGAAAAVAIALGTYGRLDAVINNAGILRDKSFAKMTMDDFDEVVRVHLGGAAYVTMAAWPALRESGTGRVVLTSSASGLYGSFGQANYGAAKAGLVGLLHTLKLEGARAGILVNAIAPVARTRMTEPLLPPEVSAGLDPALVSPVVSWFASPECDRSGLVIEVGAGLLARVQVIESEPVRFLAEGGADHEASLPGLIAALEASPAGEPYPSGSDALNRFLSAAGASSA